jgi:amino acid transporter
LKNYKKSLGTFELVSLGVGGTIGSGIFVVPGIAAGIAGPSSLLAWLIVAVSASAVMFSLALASSRYPSTGAFCSILHEYSKECQYPCTLYLISSVFGIATIAAGIGCISLFWNRNVLLLEILIIVLFCLINIKGISFQAQLKIY